MNSHAIRALRLALATCAFALVTVPACTPAPDAATPQKDGAAADAPQCAPALGGRCAWTSCPGSLEAACARSPGSCIVDWPSDMTAFCAAHNASSPTSSTAVAVACGPYHALLANSVDGGDNYYYSAQTGKLVAMVAHDYVFMTAECLGGPPEFVEPTCDWVNLDCHDAGAAGSAGAAGADAGP